MPPCPGHLHVQMTTKRLAEEWRWSVDEKPIGARAPGSTWSLEDLPHATAPIFLSIRSTACGYSAGKTHFCAELSAARSTRLGRLTVPGCRRCFEFEFYREAMRLRSKTTEQGDSKR